MLEAVCFAFVAQVLLLVLGSLVSQVGPTFVGRAGGGFSMDYGDFYLAARYHAAHRSIYSTGGFVWPPFAVLIGQLFQSMPFVIARYWWLVLNVGFVATAVIVYARQPHFTWRNTVLLMIVAASFYPTHFLLERGHVDGLMLFCLVMAFRVRHWLARSVFYGMSIGIKLYSGLLVVYLARRKRWALLAGGIAAAAVIQLPWLGLALSYPGVLARRTTQWIVVENITPAPLFFTLLGWLGERGWKIAFALFWLVTLGWCLRGLKDRGEDLSDWVLLAPWMISMPLVVYPYSAVLTLPLLAYQASRVKDLHWKAPEWIFVSGFLLLGVQQNAWIELLVTMGAPGAWVYLLNSLGTALLMVGCCLQVDAPAREGTPGAV
jgi:hypothetical protein